jgi:hypothetical protein
LDKQGSAVDTRLPRTTRHKQTGINSHAASQVVQAPAPPDPIRDADYFAEFTSDWEFDLFTAHKNDFDEQDW